ncbi:helix-turn-helix domain-containing protein [Proteiniphilum sp. UBA5259]|uniref:helix-turn-helix domain-containing protein n=2 Tax=unclassified Proteiniphilum TaxID=2622718 RepID=UPI000E80BA6F|nr:helix-turn-helix transcriptional regulator [Proteiniphilum sp. UBA5259]HBG58049.1 hypothetical protein [Porphyromonadaceae bacterium]
MNMKLTEKYNVDPEFEDLFSYKSKKEEIEHEAKMIMFRLLSSFEKIMDRPIQKKEIAEAINTSPSYVTQLFKGDKLINFITLAKLEKAFDFTFDIEARKNNNDLKEKAERAAKLVQLKPRFDLHCGFPNVTSYYKFANNEQDKVNAKAL